MNEFTIETIHARVIVVGSGAAGFAAANALYDRGVRDVVIVTEHINCGTSRNTGSDKQTYYKLSLCGDDADSVRKMAETLYDGGCMDGDLALAEAAGSAECFFDLVRLGVPFPRNRYGEYAGYKTDHDPAQRASSAGPLTSKMMTEALQRETEQKNIPVYSGWLVVRILQCNNRVQGILCLGTEEGPEKDPVFRIFQAPAIIWATGGPAGIYYDSVYPHGHHGASGIAFLAGAKGRSLTEWQYGLASVRPRWNVSGTYQQVLPRYVSVDENGIEREFLTDAFSSEEEMLSAIFSKGYEWPFDPKKTTSGGSSRVDLAVFREKQAGRRVFLDYRENPSSLMKNGHVDFSRLPEKARVYLENSEALLSRPIERLMGMNRPAVELYAAHGIDLSCEMLEIAVCAQHCNGGLSVNRRRESTTLRNFYAVGECAGTFGVYRPGGSALNATQTGALLAAMDIAAKEPAPSPSEEGVRRLVVSEWERLLSMRGDVTREEILSRRRRLGERMSDCAAFLRNPAKIDAAFSACRDAIASFDADYGVCDETLLIDALINRDILVTQLVFLGALRDYLADGGGSRGSYLVTDGDAEKALHEAPALDISHGGFVQNTRLSGMTVSSFFEPVRPLPESDQWFERVWNRYREMKK